jgi:hypothetical protein
MSRQLNDFMEARAALVKKAPNANVNIDEQIRVAQKRSEAYGHEKAKLEKQVSTLKDTDYRV